jgi:hypothetical protein
MFTKVQIAALHAKLDAALKEFAAENNLVAGSSQIKYGESDFKVAVSFSDKIANPDEVDPRFLIDLRRNGWQHGLTAEMVGKEVKMPGRHGLVSFKFIGMRASKCIFKSSVDGKNYLFHTAAAAIYLKAAK